MKPRPLTVLGRLLCCAWLLTLVGCSQPAPDGFIGFVVNPADGVGGQGKSHKTAPASIQLASGAVVLSGGDQTDLPVALTARTEKATLNDCLGQTLAVTGGTLGLGEGPPRSVDQGELTIQTLQGSIVRGNFKVRAGNVEAVGSFDAITH